jgi:hypothetical protein
LWRRPRPKLGCGAKERRRRRRRRRRRSSFKNKRPTMKEKQAWIQRRKSE